MTDHARHPPKNRNGARWLCPGKIIVTVDGKDVELTRDEAMQLAQELVEVLQMECL